MNNCINNNPSAPFFMRMPLAVVFILLVSGCTKTENGLVFGMPDYEKRDIAVTNVDLDILIRADELLSTENLWEKGAVSRCGDSNKLSLYCALEKASINVTGKYVHRQPALQEVRFVIDDHYRNRWEKHRLIDFNANQATTFSDIKDVLKKAMKSVENKLRITNSSS